MGEWWPSTSGAKLAEQSSTGSPTFAEQHDLCHQRIVRNHHRHGPAAGTGSLRRAARPTQRAVGGTADLKRALRLSGSSVLPA